MYGGAGSGLMINADTEEKDLAWQFIEYLLSLEVSAQCTEGIGAIPVHASAIDSDYVQSSDVIRAFVEAAPQLRPNPNVAGWMQVRDALVAHPDEALYGGEQADGPDCGSYCPRPSTSPCSCSCPCSLGWASRSRCTRP